MDSKNKIILIESFVLVLLLGFVFYGYNQYSKLNMTYNNLKTEFESFTNFGTSKVKLPIDTEYEALVVALNSENYNNFIQSLKSDNKELPELMYHTAYVPSDVVNHARQKESYNWIPNDVESLYVVTIIKRVPNENTFSEDVFNLYINPKNGNIIKAVRQGFY